MARSVRAAMAANVGALRPRPHRPIRVRSAVRLPAAIAPPVAKALQKGVALLAVKPLCQRLKLVFKMPSLARAFFVGEPYNAANSGSPISPLIMRIASCV